MKKYIKSFLSHLFISILSIALFITLINYDVISIKASDNTKQNETSSIINKVDTNNNLKEGSLQEIAENTIPSIVTIQTYSLKSLNVAGEGSGIILSNDGYIVTNAHVIEESNSVKVVLVDGTSYEAKIVGSDKVTDLALLKIEANNLPQATFGNSDNLRVADQVMAIGNPSGIKFSSSVTIGYLSALNRSVESNGYTMSLIQTDAAINPGNSGGALVNTNGEVIGINSAKIVATGYEGIGFAIPSNVAIPIIESLKEYGYVKDRAIIGITYQFIDETTAKFYNLVKGVYINSVTSENANNSGLKKGDIIVSIDNTKIDDISTLTNFLASKKPDDNVQLKVFRDNKYLNINLVLSENTN